MSSGFWNDRFRSETYLYGTAPNRFVRQEAARLPEGGDVLELGTGEGRNAVYLAEQGFNVTAVDYAEEGVRKLGALADMRGVTVATIHADVTTWTPERTWDGLVITFLHLAPDDRPRLYRLIHQVLRPGGVLVAEWFRPEQITEGYESGGPPSLELMITADELRTHFPSAGIQHLTATEVVLDEGVHRGPAAVVRLVWQKPESTSSR